MFKTHDINGEQGLLYLLKETEILQSFHMGMLATNLQMGAIPLQCTYYESREAVYFRTGHLVSVERYLNENRAMNLSWIIKGLAETVKQLMSHQLFPENICFDSQHIFLDLQNRTVHLIYIPVKSTLFEAKSKLCQLLRDWIELYVNHNGSENQMRNDFNPMMMKLLLTIQQETTSFSNLLSVMSTLGAFEQQQPSQYQNQQYPFNHENYNLSGYEQPPHTESEPNLNNNQYQKPRQTHGKNPKVPKEKPEMTKEKNLQALNQLNLDFVSQHKKGFALGGACLMLGIILLAMPLALETKLGSLLITCALGVLAGQKLGMFTPKKEKKATATHEKSRPKNPTAPVKMEHREMPSQSTAEYPVDQIEPPIVKAEETVWIDQNRKSGVLMLRSELGSKFYTLNKEITSIGRNPSLCDVLIDEAGVGRVHAEIHKTEDKFYIKDIQSLNGSFVNGRKIPTNQYFELKTGDQIKIGTKEVIFT